MYCRGSTDREYVGSTDACHCGAGRVAMPVLTSHRHTPNSSSKYSVRAVHVVGTFERLVTDAFTVYALGVPINGPPRVRSSLKARRCMRPVAVTRQKL